MAGLISSSVRLECNSLYASFDNRGLRPLISIDDVFTGGAEPIELFTDEFVQGLSNLLNQHGVIAIVSNGCLL